jgi:O-succinylbenzoate synthase
MKIDHIRMRHLRMKLKYPFETSFGRIQTRDCILLEVSSEGTTGYGECVADWDPGYSYETVGTAWHILEDFIFPAILQQEILDPEDLQNKILFVRGHQMAKAGLEMALWDLIGKQRGESLKTMIGGERLKVKVGVSIGIQKTPSALVQKVEDFISAGYQRIKIKIKPGRDIIDTKSVRDAFPNIQLQVDANSAYTLPSAKELLPLDDLDLLLVEQPLAEDDIWDHSQLQRTMRSPICLDESILSARHARQAIEMEACRIINIKAGRVGGLHQAIAIHDLCLDNNTPVWCGGMLETGVGRASNLALASLPGFSLPGDISASERYYEEDITHERFKLNPDSTIIVPEAPGLGITIDQESLERATVRQGFFS